LEGDSTAVIELVDHASWPSMKPLIQQMSSSGNDNITVRGFKVNVNYEGNSEISLGKGYYNIMYFINCKNIKVYNISTSLTRSENHLSPLRFQTFNRKVF
jgi:hypothetical protein